MVAGIRFFGAFFLVVLVFHASGASAATISFSPASGTHGTGEEFSVRVTVVPASGETVNAAEGTLSFDPAVLSVSSVSRDGSVFSLWTSDPTFSNSAGTISFSGGTPSAFSSSGTVLTIKFKGKAVGAGSVSVKQASILAADGKGTNVYAKGSDASYTISASAPKPAPAPAPAPTEDVASASGTLVPPPDITSSTHKKAELWYATTTAILSWKVPPGMITVRTGISDVQGTKPTKSHTPVIATETFYELAEGVWYFSAQFKDDFEWGDVAVREVKVDVTQPEEFDIALLDRGDGTPPKFVFGTTDTLSGMSRYEIHIDGAIAATAKPEELVDNAFPIPPQEGGAKSVTVKAYDGAGNVREVTKQMELPLVVKVDPRAALEVPVESGFRVEWIIIAVFAFVTGGLAAWQYQMKKTTQAEQIRILDRVIAIREKNDKIFAAMREEFEQLIQDFDERPQLTPQERDLLEKIKEVLDISEEVVDSDIEELKKLVKHQ